MKKHLRVLAIATGLLAMSAIGAAAAEETAASNATPATPATSTTEPAKATPAKMATAKTASAKSTSSKTASAPTPGMSTFLIVSPHTPEECLQVLDETSAMGAANLSKWEWGCMTGDHTGYAMVQAASDEDALKMVPESVRANAKVTKLNKFSAAQIKALHEKK